jgi:thymidylate synthase (FAD)
MKVELLDYMGDDLAVVNAARVSFDKESDWDYLDKYGGNLSTKDVKLIHFLASHGHEQPFAHCIVKFRVKAPLFTARQLWKSHIGLASQDDGLTWNEVSRRYVDSEPEFYVPEVWRKRVEDKKQGSSNEAVDEPLRLNFSNKQTTTDVYKRYLEISLDLYKELLENNTCPELARIILPQSTMTEWIWTGSLLAFSRIYRLRTGEGAQNEAGFIVTKIGKYLEPLFPVSWKALTNE